MKSRIQKLSGFAATKIFLVAILVIFVFVNKSFAQDSAKQNQLSGLLSSYYAIKDALVSGNAATASAKATDFVTLAKSVDGKNVSQTNLEALEKDAGGIAETKDIKHQREHFASLSTDMAALAKSVKLSDLPIYQAYCPMKKSYWLSSEKTIKNPYFGSAMLTCGKVTETL